MSNDAQRVSSPSTGWRETAEARNVEVGLDEFPENLEAIAGATLEVTRSTASAPPNLLSRHAINRRNTQAIGSNRRDGYLERERGLAQGSSVELRRDSSAVVIA